jgi:hypothetical protein
VGNKDFSDSLKQLAISIRIWLMKDQYRIFTRTPFALGFFALCALAPLVQAVNPPLTPDPGPKPVSNTADGANALLGITTGIHNTAIGFDSLLSNSAGKFNTAVGSATLLLNVGDPSAGEGIENTAVGTGALLSNTTGSNNTANGAFALFSNIAGFNNTAVGNRALLLSTGENNTGIGAGALSSNTDGDSNTAVGVGALVSNTTGTGNTATGLLALSANQTGVLNTALGIAALQNSTASNNTAVGSAALNQNLGGGSNTAVGVSALGQNQSGGFNTAIGVNALASNTNNFNTAIGLEALLNNTSGSDNIAVGVDAGSNVVTASNVIAIGNPGQDISDSCFIGNIHGAAINPLNAAAVLVDEFGQLGTIISSRRFKRDIEPMNRASEAILALKPVTFHYKNDAKKTSCFGLIAEEVAEVNPELVVHDKNGEILSVRYDQVNAMLLNEFLKEHKKVEDQQATIAELKSTVARQQKGMEAVTAQLNEQAAEIQKVSLRVELNTLAPQVVRSNRNIRRK